jgi:hypothetical protein
VARFLPFQRPHGLEGRHSRTMSFVIVSAGLSLRAIRDGCCTPCREALGGRLRRRFVHLGMVPRFAVSGKPRGVVALAPVRRYILVMVNFLRELFEKVRSLERRMLAAQVPDCDTAHWRAIELLKRNLSPEQRQQFARTHSFCVVGNSSGARYRIRCASALNVDRLDELGMVQQKLCFGPEGHLPVGDIMLAQKLALELFEAEAVAGANVVPRQGRINPLVRPHW